MKVVGSRLTDKIGVKAPLYTLDMEAVEFSVTVTDFAGLTSKEATHSVIVTANDPFKPRVIINGDNEVQESTNITLTADVTSIANGRNITSYEWGVPRDWTLVGGHSATMEVTAPAMVSSNQSGHI